MGAGGYESWFVSARDPASPRALWIRHTRHRPRPGPESAALWCTVVDHDLGQRPVVVKQVFGAFPPDAAAGPGQFRGQAAMQGRPRAGTWPSPAGRRRCGRASRRAVPCAAAAHQARGQCPRWPGHRPARSRWPPGRRVGLAGRCRPQLGIPARRFLGMAARRGLRRRTAGAGSIWCSPGSG